MGILVGMVGVELIGVGLGLGVNIGMGLGEGRAGLPSRAPPTTKDCLGARVPTWVTGRQRALRTTSLGLGGCLLRRVCPRVPKQVSVEQRSPLPQRGGLGSAGLFPALPPQPCDSVYLLKEMNS